MLVAETLIAVAVREVTEEAEFWELGHVQGETGVWDRT